MRSRSGTPRSDLVPDDRELTLALEHPRGTERRRLLPLREGLASPAAYAALAVAERDVIVRWAEVRRRLRRDHGLDRDEANLADPLLSEAMLRALVVEGEALAAGRAKEAAALIAAAEREGVPVVVAGLRGDVE